MGKCIKRNGKHFRMREGKLVEIPEEWVGKIPNRQTMKKRKTYKQKLKKKGGR